MSTVEVAPEFMDQLRHDAVQDSEYQGYVKDFSQRSGLLYDDPRASFTYQLES